MTANRPVTMRIKKDDMVKIISGAHKGKTGKVLKAHPATQMVTIDGIGMMKRNIKPNQQKPQGGTKEIHRPMHVSKVALLTEKDKTTRIGYQVKKDGTKVRIARQNGNKEIK